MCPVMVKNRAMATQSWTNVAPVRHDSGHGLYQCMIDPVASITSMAPPVKAALSFWPALNLPCFRPVTRSGRQPRRCSHIRSSGIQRFSRRRSARSRWPQRRPTMPSSSGNGSSKPGVDVDGDDDLPAAHGGREGGR